MSLFGTRDEKAVFTAACQKSLAKAIDDVNKCEKQNGCKAKN